MTETSRTSPGIVRKNLLTLVILLVIFTSLIIPGVKWWQNPATPPMESPAPGELFTPIPPFKSTVAGEANFTRESWPFILKNYPAFSWKNPGQFDASITDGVGYNPALPAPGTGPEAHPAIFNALEGLNESYIRIAYLDANYEWQIVPFQIDQVGWPNVWHVADLNQWAGMNIFSQPDRGGADAVAGMGWINGDSVDSLGNSDGSAENNLWVDWYRIPIHSYVTTYQPDGSYTSESVNIDQEYKEDLVWCYMGDARRPHGTYTYAGAYWNFYGSGQEAFVNTSDVLIPDVNTSANMVFMGDTWYITPSNNPSNPQWVRDAYNYTQIDGMLDKDDEIAFYVYPGRKAPSNFWWNQSWFPHRFELEIVDPVDGGRCWMYLYYNNDGSGINPGVPSFTTDLKDYVSWDPDTLSVTSDLYQLSVDETNPSLLEGVRLFGETDGQPLLESFNKMYGFGEASVTGLMTNQISAGREGIWYSWSDGSPHFYSELYCMLDNPSVKYPTIAEDTSDPDRTTPTSPQHYYGPRGSVLGHTYARAAPQTGSYNSPIGPSINNWEVFGDKRAVIDGPCRVITYLQQYLALGIHFDESIVCVTVTMDIDVFIPFMDGPQIYYRRMQLSPLTTTAIPYIANFDITLYYMYIMCGNIFTDLRGDYKMTAATEWDGGPDGIDDDLPTFGWANEHGWTKIGGLDPKTTQYVIEGECIPDGDGGVGDLYVSQGDPLRNADVVAATPPLSNALPDWVMLTSETHGGAWIYMPKREFFEMRDNPPASPSANILMYYRDDYYRAEFGVCIDGPIYGGSSSSPYAYMMVYGDFKHENIALGHEFYMDYYFPLEGFTSFTQQTILPQFLYESVQPDQLIYGTGQIITIEVIGNANNAIITANFTEIESTAPIMQMTNHFDGTYTLTYDIDNITSGPYERNIRLNASVPLWADSLYNLTMTIDDDPPSPAAELLALPLTTMELSVLLNWSANPGHDKGCASMANPSGLSHYRLRRGSSPSNHDTILADDIPITTTLFEDSFIQDNETCYYVLDTFDEAGNFNTSLEVFTTIALPFTPARPEALPATINPSDGITVDWTRNPGHVEGSSLDGYRVYRSSALDQETALAGPYTEMTSSEITETTFTDPGPFLEPYYYYYKVESRNNATAINSSAVHARIDTIAPVPAELATPFPISYARKAEIIISWALETIPAYESGGFPGHDLNGIDHWVIYKKTDAGPWTMFRTVPHNPEVKDQRIVDISVVNGSTYAYSIRTFDAAGNSALCEYNKTMTLHVVGPGIAEVYSVEAGTSEVTQGDQDIPITVTVRNPGISDVSLNEVKLYFVQDSTNITADYMGVVQTPNSTLAAFINRTYMFYVNVSDGATLGTVTIKARTLYNNTMSSIGTSHPDSWLVKPDADLITQSVTSTCSVIHPGETNIPVTVLVTNPGDTLATIETVQLIFERDDTDISDKFLVDCITGLPMGGFTGSQIINFNVIISQAITTGGLTVDAIISGSASGVSLSDEDGAESKLIWAVGTPILPIIANVEADQEIYWSPDVITLTVTCDSAGYSVRADFSPVDVGALNETGTDNGDGTYTLAHALVNPVDEGSYEVRIYATNSSKTVTGTIRIRLGMAPTFSNWTQTPPDGSVLPGQAVGVTIDIDDNGGADDVQAILKYRVDGRPWVCRPMSYHGSGHWQITIPGQKFGSKVNYIVNATDMSNNWALFSKNYTCVGLDLISPRNQSYGYQNIPIVVYNTSKIFMIWYRNNSGMGWSSNHTLVFNGTHFVNNSSLRWPDGFHHVQVFVNYSSGAEFVLDRWMIVDTQNPSGFQWFNSTSQYTQNKPMIWINGTAHDPPPSSGISTFNIFISGSNTSALWSTNIGSQADWAFYNLSPLQETKPNEMYQINVTMIDNAGNAFTLSCNISVDATPPSGWQYLNTSLLQNAKDGMVWINGSAIDYGSGLKRITIVSDNVTGGTSWSINLGSNQSWSFTNASVILDSPPNSVYEVLVEITDLANNSHLLPCYFSIDTTPPGGNQSLRTSLPQNGDLNSFIWLNGTSFDAGTGVNSVSVLSDNVTGGTTWGSNLGSLSNWAFRNTSPIIDTPAGCRYEVLVKITDLANNSYLLPCYIFVDTTTPNGSQAPSTFHTNIQSLDINGRVWVNGTASDLGSGLQSIFIQNTNITGGSNWVNVGTLSNWAFYNTTPIPEPNYGEVYLIEINITDLVNNSVILECYISLDFTLPTLVQSAPTINWQSGPWIWVNGTAFDLKANVTQVTIVNDNFTSPVSWTPNVGTNESWAFTNTSPVPDGCWEISIQAFDAVGNFQIFSALIKIDNTPPSACNFNYSIMYAPSYVLENTIFVISGGSDFGGSGISHLQYKLDAGDWVAASNFILAGSSNGPHVIYYRAVDNVGNNGSVQNIAVYLLANNADYDNDALTNYAEIYIHRTIAINPDTDGDGLPDGAEVITHGTDPNIPDMDGDGLSDGAEVITHGTDPTDPDTDDDGISDGKEIAMGADPLNPMNPLIGRILFIIEITGVIMLAGIIIRILKKKRKTSPPSHKLIPKETLGVDITRSIINALPFLNQVFEENGKLNLPTELLNFSFKELFSFNDTIIGWVPNDEIKSRLNVLLRKFENIEKKEDWERVLPNLKELVELAESLDDRELYDKLIQLMILIKYS